MYRQVRVFLRATSEMQNKRIPDESDKLLAAVVYKITNQRACNRELKHRRF